jgi:hypothetical protein
MAHRSAARSSTRLTRATQQHTPFNPGKEVTPNQTFNSGEDFRLATYVDLQRATSADFHPAIDS